MITRTIVFLSSLFLLANIAQSKPLDVTQPQVVGLYFNASWCSACKMLDPQLQAASEDLKKSPFLLVKLDVSNRVTQHQAGMLASAIGYGDLYSQTGVKTGFVVLLDSETGEEIGRITKDDDAAAIVNKVKALTKA
ncbi:thioredoxin family protein [Pelagicoccus enzymogenes]|uniref:thioredoxin family protein n=1 Tax=Pelagicoccus enzymogenes TaxID=2773457 RepID=UPI00280CA5EB|nr:thioredoxin family protein [Pelagicoccus enzymogenes]MDQ8196919.1 thioredoxin family protein [Pelagicoccus enzymogenes]